MTYERAASKFGTVMHNGAVLALTQQAWVDNYLDGVRYFASAIDRDGNEYRVAWDTTAAWDARMADSTDNCDDQSEACDWTAPAEITAL